MNRIEVRKTDLLEKLRTNRDQHRKVFEEALTGWRGAVLKELEQMVADAMANKQVSRVVTHTRPEDHTKDYDRVIAMLEMDVAESVELNERDFAEYVMDDWGWKDQWSTSNVAYAASLR